MKEIEMPEQWSHPGIDSSSMLTGHVQQRLTTRRVVSSVALVLAMGTAACIGSGGGGGDDPNLVTAANARRSRAATAQAMQTQMAPTSLPPATPTLSSVEGLQGLNDAAQEYINSGQP